MEGRWRDVDAGGGGGIGGGDAQEEEEEGGGMRDGDAQGLEEEDDVDDECREGWRKRDRGREMVLVKGYEERKFKKRKKKKKRMGGKFLRLNEKINNKSKQNVHSISPYVLKVC